MIKEFMESAGRSDDKKPVNPEAGFLRLAGGAGDAGLLDKIRWIIMACRRR